MLEASLKKYNFPMDKLEEADVLKTLIKAKYNQLKRENKKTSRQELMDQAVVEVYNTLKEVSQ